MTDLLYIILVIILNSMFFFTFGFIAGYKIIEKKTTTVQTDKPTSVQVPTETMDSTTPNDVINHEGVGIVYRPTPEELEKFNEDPIITANKEAIAEELRNAKEPLI